jgi:transcription initiation factor TFIIIB Brf1 subunit/transcription initiation factor TFIIB
MTIETMINMRTDFNCPECNGKISHSIKESYCTECGLVLDDSPTDDTDSIIDENGNKSNSRTGQPTKLWELPGSII